MGMVLRNGLDCSRLAVGGHDGDYFSQNYWGLLHLGFIVDGDARINPEDCYAVELKFGPNGAYSGQRPYAHPILPRRRIRTRVCARLHGYIYQVGALYTILQDATCEIDAGEAEYEE